MLAAEIDRAIREPKDDRLGLQPFADGIAGTLLADDRRTARGVVLGLEGAWGSGKSSGLNHSRLASLERKRGLSDARADSDEAAGGGRSCRRARHPLAHGGRRRRRPPRSGTSMPTATPEQLHAMTRAICIGGGSDEREAALVADHLVGANLAGHDSHGVGMLPAYVESVVAGRLIPNQHINVMRDTGPLVVIEGGRGYGQVIGFEAMGLGVERARTHGVALLGIRNSFHLGRIGHWGEQCARQGCASVHFVNGIDHGALQAPFGGGEARLSTNPFCVTLPGRDGPSVVLDMATSKIAMGKARVAHNKGVEVPEDSVLDVEGFPTRNPGVMFGEPRGALVAMGEHKGSGLAILCELLAGALTGGWTIQPEHPQAGGIINNMLSIVIDPEAMGERDALYREIEALLGWVKASKPRQGFEQVLVPGEPEQQRRALRQRDGIPVDERTFTEIEAAAAAVGIDGGRFERLFA